MGDRTIRGQKALGLPGGLEPLHPAFPLARGVVGVFGPIIQLAVLAAFDTGEHLPLHGAVALELVRDDHPWDILTPLEELPKELLGGLFIAPALDQDMEDNAVLIRGAPQIVPLPIDREKHLITVPLVAWLGAPALQLIGILLAKCATPLADGLIGRDHPTNKEKFLHIAVAEAELIIQPDPMADNLGRKAAVLVTVGLGWSIHAASMPHCKGS